MYDAVVGGPRRGTSGLVDSEGRLGGPLNTLLYAPALGTAQQGVGAALRFQISLSRRVVELVILAVAHDAQSEFELAAHEPMAHGVGLTHEQLAALSTEGSRSWTIRSSGSRGGRRSSCWPRARSTTPPMNRPSADLASVAWWS